MEARVSREDDVEVIHLTLHRWELALLAGSINEALEAVEDWEFFARLGVEVGDARQMLAEIGEFLRSLPPLE